MEESPVQEIEINDDSSLYNKGSKNLSIMREYTCMSTTAMIMSLCVGFTNQVVYQMVRSSPNVAIAFTSNIHQFHEMQV